MGKCPNPNSYTLPYYNPDPNPNRAKVNSNPNHNLHRQIFAQCFAVFFFWYTQADRIACSICLRAAFRSTELTLRSAAGAPVPALNEWMNENARILSAFENRQ